MSPKYDCFQQDALDLADANTSLQMADEPKNHSGGTHPGHLWLCIYLPQLPLEAMAQDRLVNTHPGIGKATNALTGKASGKNPNADGTLDRSDQSDVMNPALTPRAIVVRQHRREVILCLNESAKRAGVQVGMTSSTALSVAPELAIVRRDLQLEHDALQGLALWCSRFSSRLRLQDDALLLEIGGSLRLFGGLNALLQDLLSGLKGLGFSVSVSIAPTLLAAEWMARSHTGKNVLSLEQLPSVLGTVPVTVLQLSESVHTALQRLGVRFLRDLYRLPRADLGRRFGPALVCSLDQALGRRGDAREMWTMPQIFERRLVLGHGSREHEYLLGALNLLLIELVGLLQVKAAAVCKLEVILAHHRHPATRFVLELVCASRDQSHLLGLLAQRLERLALPQPVEEVGLRAPTFVHISPMQSDLYIANSTPQDSLNELVERLTARLGRRVVSRPAVVSDHRPEYQAQIVPFISMPMDSARNPARAASSGADLDLSLSDGYMDSKNRRPLWLLSQPRRLQQRDGFPYINEPLRLIDGPERISAGWWDGHLCSRDYYRADTSNGASYWIYCERRGGERSWYMQGIFS